MDRRRFLDGEPLRRRADAGDGGPCRPTRAPRQPLRARGPRHSRPSRTRAVGAAPLRPDRRRASRLRDVHRRILQHHRPADELSPMSARSRHASPKALEAIAFERLMCGSTENLDRQSRMVEMMVSQLGDDGLYWVTPDLTRKPWMKISEPFAMGSRPGADAPGHDRLVSSHGRPGLERADRSSRRGPGGASRSRPR